MKRNSTNFPPTKIPADLKVADVIKAWKEAQAEVTVSLPPQHPAYNLIAAGELNGVMTVRPPHRHRHPLRFARD